MSWDPIWERIFRESGWGRYPNEELIRFMARNYYRREDRSAVRVLEIGCGNGANVWYLAKEGFDTTGVDGSDTAIDMARDRLKEEGVNATCLVGDVVQLEETFEAGSFDAVVDIGCLQCNNLENNRRIIEQSRRVLKDDGRMFALIVSRGSWGDGAGEELEPGTYKDIQEGPLKDRGVNHFYSREEIDDLWSGFSSLAVESVGRTFLNGTQEYRTWTVDAGLA